MKKIRSKMNHIPLLTHAKGDAFRQGIAAARAEQGCHHTKHLLQERVVYSLLAYRSRKGLGASVREISRTTGLHHKTIRATLNNLADLAHEYDGKWYANEPPKGWFREHPDHDVSHWSERYAYTWLLLPRHGATFQVGEKKRRFSLNHAVIYCYLLSFADSGHTIHGFTVAGLSTMLHNLNQKTINSVLGDLESLELIEQRYKSVKLLPFEERHLALFAPPKKLAAANNEEPKPVSRPETNKYELKHDGFDDHRRLCQAFMTQGYAERAIRTVRFLGWNLTDFHIHLENRKKDSEDNVKKGKCVKENFGKFYVTPLEERVAAIKKERKLAEAKQRQIEFLNSPEGRQAEAREREAIAADPLHRLHTVDGDSIRARVRFDSDHLKNWREADRVKDRVYRHCQSHIRTLDLSTQESIERTGDLVQTILQQALAKLNGYYQQEELGTAEQLYAAIDEAIRKIQPRMVPMFAKEVPEVHCA